MNKLSVLTYLFAMVALHALARIADHLVALSEEKNKGIE